MVGEWFSCVSTRLPRPIAPLTLIQPGKVKVDLANFDVKFQTKFLYVGFFKLTYSCRKVLRIFLNFWHDVKKWHFDFHFDIFSSEVGTWRQIVNPPSFRLVLLCIQTTRGREKSRRSMVCSPVRGQSTFQSVSGRGPRGVRGVAGSQSGPLSLSFLVYSWRRTVLGRFPKP
jgi:hypothetical protein